jgi:peptidoglycan-associated lipoprotein
MRCSTMREKTVAACVLAVMMIAAGCGGKNTPAPVPSTPAPPVAPLPRPTATLTASSTFVRAGDKVTLNWNTTNSTDQDLEPGIGKVAPEGSNDVTLTDSTTYTLAVSGPGGSNAASVRITVSPQAPPQPVSQASPSMEQLFKANVFDAYFDFNKYDIRADAREGLSKTAQFLRSYPDIHIVIEGHCDDRGSTEYNLGLGERRAQAVKDFLVSLGVPANRVETTSYGKERPFCTEETEECWQQNRRGHVVQAQ